MIIRLPSYIYNEKYGINTIQVKLIDSIEDDFNVQNKSKGSFKGFEIETSKLGKILILSKKSSSKILDNYDKILILKTGNISDLSSLDNEFEWIKHPLIVEKKIKSNDVEEISNTWKNNFKIKQETDTTPGLRLPQIGALYSILAHYTISDSVSTVVMPTGTGKTETMIGALLSLKSKKGTLIIVPSDALRTQVSSKFISFGLFKKLGLIDDSCKYPIVGVLKSKIKDKKELADFLSKTNVVVTTMSIIGGYDVDFQEELSKHFDYVYMDEAHHSQANTWSKFKKIFGNKNIIQFTATPFRNDRQNIGGKIIYNFPLKKAQEEGLFKSINFIPLYIYDKKEADKVISEKAIEVLESDISKGYNHIIMARCESVEDAENIYKNYYSKYERYNPVIIHTDSKRLSTKQKNENLELLKNLKSNIVVCVDMLGEGYDLPNLKIAALHYSHKSLGVTLQFIGRFTRKDKSIGDATFITNIIDEKFKDGLNRLYSTDADWNKIISEISGEKIKKETQLKDFIGKFGDFNLEDFSLPLESLKVKYSSVFFKVNNITWNEDNIISIIEKTFNKEDIVFTINNDDKTFVVIEKIDFLSDFSDLKELQGRNWKLTVLSYDEVNNLVCVQTDTLILAKELVGKITNDDCKFIEQESIFKSFYGIDRLQLFIVGLYEGVGGKTKYRMHAGLDIAKELEKSGFTSQKIKSNIFASGYEKGMPISIGAAGKRGKVRSKFKGNILGWKEWSKNIGIKLNNPLINDEEILKGVLMPKEVDKIPDLVPITIEWPLDVYKDFFRYGIEYKGEKKNIEDITIELSSRDAGKVKFMIFYEDIFKVEFELKIENKKGVNKYSFVKISGNDLGIYKGEGEIHKITDFFNDYSPIVRYANGSILEGNYFTEIKYDLVNFTDEEIIEYDWIGVDINKESKGLPPGQINNRSIQYKVINYLKKEDYSIIFNDDGSGEIADIVTIKVDDKEQKIDIKLFHCKFSKDKTPGGRVGDLYEVCGQAQKSIRWADPRKILTQIIHRGQKNENRFEIGSNHDIEILLKKIELYSHNIEIYIVQPGLSKNEISTSQKELLSVTKQYLKTSFNIDLYVYASK